MSLRAQPLYISDLDGTLLSNQVTLSAFSRQGLKQLLKRGMAFTVATSRSIGAIQHLLGEIPLELPVIEQNGAFATDFFSGKSYCVNALESSLGEEVLGIFLTQDIFPILSVLEGEKNRLLYQQLNNQGMVWFIEEKRRKSDSRLESTKDLYQATKYPVLSFVVFGEKREVEAIAMQLERQFSKELLIELSPHRYCSEFVEFVVHDSQAGKEKAISQLMDIYGFSSENLTVFGDDRNDLTMMKMARHAIAVENAIPEMKFLATEIIGKNEEDAVVRYLLKKQEPCEEKEVLGGKREDRAS